MQGSAAALAGLSDDKPTKKTILPDDTDPKSKERYEYNVLWFTLSEWELGVKEVNEMSSQGWRVVSTESVGESVLVFMERRR
jgi:hypothetical protein